MTCTSCGRTNRPDARFCDGCGAPLAMRAGDAAEARKVVTIVFADLIGSTSLHERLDPESTRRLMDRYYRAVRAPVEAHGGTVVQLLGDGVVCAFGVPRVAEDDAIRAVRAAVGIQDAFREFAREQRSVAGAIGLRVAVNTGEVVVSDAHDAGIGDPFNVAARLQEEAHDGDVLISESTQRLVAEQVTLAPFGVLSLKGRAETVATYRVCSLERPAGSAHTPFIGRDAELRQLTAAFDATVASRRARLALIVGSPGLGKSRLIDELLRRLRNRATVVTAHCDAAGGASFAPLAEPLRMLLRIDEGSGGEAVRAAIDAAVPGDAAERARIAEGIAALLSGTPAPPEETFFVVRRLLGALAGAQPLVLAIDDLQWAEPLLLDLVEHLVQWSSAAPLFVLGAARPELRDTRAALLVPGPTVADVITLAGLDADAAARLAAGVIGADALPAAVAGRVLAASEGNPLFVGELVRMLVHDGAIKREGERWITGVELADLEMPPTIQALLAARIERLRPEERTVLERAAVIGRQFSRSAVAHLLPPGAATDLDGRLEALRRSELIEADPAGGLGEPGLRFHHALIRDAAYRRLLKGTRAELHGRFADWLERRAGDSIEHDEAIGWHLEQAHQHLRELGPLDAEGRDFGARAARYLAAAGRRALARDDVALAASLLGRAIDRLDGGDAARAELALDWCEALLAAGAVGAATAAIDELGRFTGAAARLRAWHTCFAGQLAALTDPQALHATADAVAAAVDQLAAAGDAAGEAKAHSVHAVALARLGKVGESEAALDRALAAARRAGDRRRANAVLAGAPLAALRGPSPVTRASGRCLDVVRVLRITQGAPAVEAVALRCQAVLEALRGRSEAARRMIASSRRMVEELGITQRLLEADVFAGLIELLEGDAAAAERCLRGAYEGLREHGLGIDAAQAAALLGRALLAQGRAGEAEALSHDSEALAGDDLTAAIAWRGVRAEALAHRGEHRAALRIARAAVDLAAATDALLDHADARLALAATLRAGGDASAAALEEERAIELWDAKGATLLADRARAARGATRAPQVAPGDAAPAVPRRVRANRAAASLGSEYETLATLGDRLALYRQGAVPAGAGVAAQPGRVVLVEVDAGGAPAGTAHFPSACLADAVVRLYTRHAELLGDGAGAARAGATARSMAALLGRFELARYAPGISADVEFIDHRMVGFPAGRGVAELLRSIGSLLDAADQVATRVDDILAAVAHTLLLRWTTFGIDRLSRGPFEWQFLRLLAFGADGLLVRAEQFDLERAEHAFVRFDAVTRDVADAGHGGPPVDRADPTPRAAGQSAIAAAGLTTAATRAIAARTGTAYRVLATRGEGLVLARRDGNCAAALLLLEVDDRGVPIAEQEFAADDVDAAYAGLEARYAATSAADQRRAAVTSTFSSAFAARDWETLGTTLAPDLVVRDHRLLGWDTLRGPTAYVQALRELVELAPDVRLRIDHIGMDMPGFLYVTTFVGTRDGGAFEAPSVIVCEIDAAGRIARFDQYDLDRMDDARAQLAAIGSRARDAAPPDSPAAASMKAYHAADLPDLLRIRPNLASRAFEQAICEGAAGRLPYSLLATVGDQLAMLRVSAGPSDAPAGAHDRLEVVETDADGHIVDVAVFPAAARRAASIEMRERFARSAEGRAMPARMFELARGIEARDAQRIRNALPDDYVFHDHRRTGIGRVEGGAAYTAALMALFEYSPDAITEDLYQLARGPDAALSVARTFGRLAEGGEFESLYLRVQEHPGGRWVASHLFELEDLALARACLDGLTR